MFLSPVFITFALLTKESNMASITLTLSSVRNKKTNKSEILLRYRNTRKVALRAHTHIYVLPEFFSDGQIVINKRRETEEVKEARAAKTKLDAMITLLEEKGSKMDIDDIGPGWAQDVIDRFMFPEHYKKADYVAKNWYKKDKRLQNAVDFHIRDLMLEAGDKKLLKQLYDELLGKDWFMTFPDFESYCKAKDNALAAYEERKSWAKKMAVNIAKAGYFSSDRTIEQYNNDIWHLEKDC